MKLWPMSVFVIYNTTAIVELNNCFITFCGLVYQAANLLAICCFGLVRLQEVA